MELNFHRINFQKNQLIFVQSLGKALGFYHKWIKWTFSLYGLASLA
jgi:hypothetical protein